MKHIRMLIAGAALLAGSFAFGASQDAVALSDTQMDQVTGEYLLIELIWNGHDYTPTYTFSGDGTANHGMTKYIGGPIGGQYSVW